MLCISIVEALLVVYLPKWFSVSAFSSRSRSIAIRRRSTTRYATPANRLKSLLESEMNGSRESETPILLPCCYDGLTARLVGASMFEATFMTGFGVSAVNGYPDTQLVSFAEMQQRCTTIAEALGSVALEFSVDPLPCIAVCMSLMCNSVTHPQFHRPGRRHWIRKCGQCQEDRECLWASRYGRYHD